MYKINTEYNFFEVSWVADPPDKTARFRLTPWQMVQTWFICRLLSVRHWLRRKVR